VAQFRGNSACGRGGSRGGSSRALDKVIIENPTDVLVS
jgi:hypothetical protein